MQLTPETLGRTACLRAGEAENQCGVDRCDNRRWCSDGPDGRAVATPLLALRDAASGHEMRERAGSSSSGTPRSSSLRGTQPRAGKPWHRYCTSIGTLRVVQQAAAFIIPEGINLTSQQIIFARGRKAHHVGEAA